MIAWHHTQLQSTPTLPSSVCTAVKAAMMHPPGSRSTRPNACRSDGVSPPLARSGFCRHRPPLRTGAPYKGGITSRTSIFTFAPSPSLFFLKELFLALPRIPCLGISVSFLERWRTKRSRGAPKRGLNSPSGGSNASSRKATTRTASAPALQSTSPQSSSTSPPRLVLLLPFSLRHSSFWFAGFLAYGLFLVRVLVLSLQISRSSLLFLFVFGL